MSKPVTMGALLKCSFGLAPCVLAVIPKPVPITAGALVATIQDYTIANVPSFGMCRTPANPAVAAATTAAAGVLTPAPCIPVIAAPWTPGALKAKICNVPVLSSDSKCVCAYGGVVEVSSPGASVVNV